VTGEHQFDETVRVAALPYRHQVNAAAAPTLDFDRPELLRDELVALRHAITARWSVSGDVEARLRALAAKATALDYRARQHTDTDDVLAVMQGLLGALVALDARQGSAHWASEVDLWVARTLDPVYRICRDLPVRPDRTPQQLSAFIADVLPGREDDVAGLCAVSARTFRRWASGAQRPTGDRARRLRTVAVLVNELRYGLTERGVVSWFDHARPWELGGRPPRALLGDPAQTSLLVRLARYGRTG
jgi:hypothetical protein